jgi:transposase
VQRWLADIRGLDPVVELRWASVAISRYRSVTPNCGGVFNQDLGKLATPRSATTRRCARYVLRRLMIGRTRVSAIAVDPGGP